MSSAGTPGADGGENSSMRPHANTRTHVAGAAKQWQRRRWVGRTRPPPTTSPTASTT